MFNLRVEHCVFLMLEQIQIFLSVSTGVCGSTCVVYLCVAFCFCFRDSWPTRSLSFSTWISGCWSWFLAVCSHRCRYTLFYELICFILFSVRSQHAVLPFIGNRHSADLQPVHGGGLARCCPARIGWDCLLCEWCVSGAGVCSGCVCCGVRGVGVTVGRVELDGSVGHYHPLLLQCVATCPGWLEKLLA